MKALIPLSNDGNFEVYDDVKNESFYFGTVLKEIFGNKINNLSNRLFNRRNNEICYFSDLKKLKQVIEKLKSKGNEIKYAVNHSFPDKYKELIKKETEKVIEEVNPDYLIIEDLDLIDIAEKHNKKVFISTRLAVLNKEEAKFFYKLIGKNLAGFVLPRQISVKEINEINKFALSKNLKLEVFFELGGCLNEERFCFFHEILDYQRNLYNKNVKLPICINIFLNSKSVAKELTLGYPMKDFFNCRSCLFAFIENTSNIYAKIVGRCFNNARNKKIYDYFKQVRNNLSIKDKERIITKNRMALMKVFGKICNKDNCPTFDLIDEY